MCNYYASKWKREHIVDHNFDYVNIDEFRDGHWFTMFLYCFKVFLIIKSVIIYAADVFTLLVLLDVVKSAFGFLSSNNYFKYVFLASIICSFLLLLWDIRKAYRIMKSRDIAFAFTDIISYNLYILKSYSYFCIFHRIENLKNSRDIITFFVFFRLKRWKRILLAEAPRQIINGYTLFDKFVKTSPSWKFDTSAFPVIITQQISITLIAVSFFLFVISALSVIFALIIYIPLVCQIQGNLKEYVCHKIDKRVGKMVTTKSKRRALENQRKQAVAAKIHQRNPSANNNLLKPTLPNVVIEEEEYEFEFDGKGSISSKNHSIETESRYQSHRSNRANNTYNRKVLNTNSYDDPNSLKPPINISQGSLGHKSGHEFRQYQRESGELRGDSNSTISEHSNSKSSTAYYYDGRKSPSSSQIIGKNERYNESNMNYNYVEYEMSSSTHRNPVSRGTSPNPSEQYSFTNMNSNHRTPSPGFNSNYSNSSRRPLSPGFKISNGDPPRLKVPFKSSMKPPTHF
ncbi:hypothetical protein K502DRAFT_368907 [Neoconidiobolus thromboides FSU 785]|nr:hypothetical protein K502DRAFT_368907 [Neoconidiobolus thromboides FSU 785]